MNRHVTSTLAAVLAAGATAGIATADRSDQGHANGESAYSIGLWADLPYSA